MRKALVCTGGTALLAATALDTAGVVGRHIGLPLHGVIELIQPAILTAGTVALLWATLCASHAKVHLVVDRLPEAWAARALRIADLASALFFAGVLAGSIWIAADMWPSHERSELVGVPWAALRVIANIGILATIIVLVRRLVRRP
ncbi:TRAP transporter small permease subunit [Novosphingobium sp. PP1Y]|uniref:TRAP transporter small permease subunit n=1 Tax=Novosphingobium sp. PP1Y TaxID=702113 RepID=UPI001E58AD70|nr:TRAP transporter small permease subunit [Novosphingobium sp. PP1Y]